MMSINVQTTISDREHAVQTIDSRSPYRGWPAKKRDIRLGCCCCCCHAVARFETQTTKWPCHLLSRSGYITWKMMKRRQIAATDAKKTKEGNRKVETRRGKNTPREKRGERRSHGKERDIDVRTYVHRFERELSSSR